MGTVTAARRPTEGAQTPDAHVALDPTPASAGRARRFARDTLAAWGCDGIGDVVALLVSELVTNAVLHARSTIDLRVERAPQGVRVEVADTSASAPVVRKHDPDAMTGRGLALVSELATEWGVAPRREGGKAVWFVVAE